MFKYLLLIGTTATIGFIAWRTYHEVKTLPPPPITKTIVTPKEIVPETTKEQKYLNKELHKAFAQILELEKENKRSVKKQLTIDELIAENLKTGSIKMTREERKLVIKKLKLDIKKLENIYANADETVDENEVEIKIGHKKEQLENFEHLEAESTGANFEN